MRPIQPKVVFVTGGSSGIGLGLAAAYHARGAKVVIASRSRDRLDSVAARYPGMDVEVIDVADPQSVAACAARVAARHPDLDLVINNAGIQNTVDFARPEPHAPETIALEIDINLKGLILVSNAFLPILKHQSSSRLVHVGSGLGFVPLASTPIYCATKAAVHSFSVSLRRQLADTSVGVVEIIPPAVETELHRGRARPARCMTLEVFVKAAMDGLDAGREEIPVGLAKALRIGSRINPGFFLRIVNKPS